MKRRNPLFAEALQGFTIFSETDILFNCHTLFKKTAYQIYSDIIKRI